MMTRGPSYTLVCRFVIETSLSKCIVSEIQAQWQNILQDSSMKYLNLFLLLPHLDTRDQNYFTVLTYALSATRI